MQCYFIDKEFGKVVVTFRRGMKNVRCRWRGNRLYMSAPYGMEKQLEGLVDADRDKIRALNHQKITFHDGQVIPCFHTTLTISTDAKLTTNCVAHGIDPADGVSLYMCVPADLDLESDAATRALSKVISLLFGRIAHRYLIPYAQSEAARLGLKPRGFEIGKGTVKLGHCTRGGLIQLSRHLMLLPEPLVQYEVCHELAHLTHMDHSPAFHACSIVTSTAAVPNSTAKSPISPGPSSDSNGTCDSLQKRIKNI